MKALKVFMAELANLKSKKGLLISVIAVLLVPVVYAAVLLSPTWHPYDNLSNLPVAVVNKDTGAVSDGEEINVGRDIVEDFKESKDLGWEFVDEKTAKRGLEDLDYYMVIEIPEDFSKNVTTVLDSNPKKPELKYIQNEGLNFMASQVTSNATQRIREQLGNKITETYVNNVFAQLEQISEGFETAADGSDQIYSGSTELKDGTNQLLTALTEKSGDIDRLASGSRELTSGTGELLQNLRGKSGDIETLASGSKELNDGTKLLLGTLKAKSGDITRLADGSQELEAGLAGLKAGSGEILAGLQGAQAGLNNPKEGLVVGSQGIAGGIQGLRDNAEKLSVAATGLKDGVTQLINQMNLQDTDQGKLLIGLSKTVSDGVGGIAVGSKDLEDGATLVAGGITQLSTGVDDLVEGQTEAKAGVDKLAAGSSELSAGASEVETGWKTLIGSVTTLNAGASQISAGNATVNQGWKTLSAGASQLHAGSQQIKDGNAAVKTGWADLTDGVTQVDAGVGQLNEGSQELASGLSDGAEQTSGISVSEENIAMFSSPVELAESKVNEYQYYRDSTAPYILSLALFVGILIMSFVVDFRKPAELETSGISWFFGKFLNLSLLAIIQAVVLSLFTLVVLQLDVGNSFAFILFAIFVSLTFLMIILFLVAVAGNIGRFAALIFIVLQLSTTGSNLPIEMLPENLQALSAYLPLTYSNAGFKSIISLENAGFVWSNTGVLALYLGLFAVLSAVVFVLRNKNQTTEYDLAE